MEAGVRLLCADAASRIACKRGFSTARHGVQAPSPSPSARQTGQRVVPTAPVYPQPAPKAYISESTHPHFNLSLEHHLLRTRPANEPVLLLYRNAPCIVIGRNQNPWHELDVSRMRALGIKLVRRRSGGGAVYHDLGNTNYSFHISREDFTRRAHAETVARALNKPPVSLVSAVATDNGDGSRGAYVNERNDICIALKPPPRSSAADLDAFRSERKISGSAYKITSLRAYHHGTMLLSSNLFDLGSALRPSRASMITKGVASVSSPVSNLVDTFASRAKHLNHDAFCQSVVGQFEHVNARNGNDVEVYHVNEGNYKHLLHDDEDALLRGWHEMDSWEWIWGQTPEFTHSITNTGQFAPHSTLPQRFADALASLSPLVLDLRVKGGIIQSAELKRDCRLDGPCQDFFARLKGARYDVLADAPDTYSSLSTGADDNGHAEWDPTAALEHLGYSSTGDGDQVHLVKSLLLWLKTVL